MKVLIIEGQQQVTDDVAAALAVTDFTVVRGLDRENATSLIHRHDSQLLVLVAHPFQGWQLQLLRDLQSWQPPPRCLAITGEEPSDVIALLEAGADAYCTYPLQQGLCAAQMLALSRRVISEDRDAALPDTVHVRDLTVDFLRYQVRFESEPLPVTPAEFRILACLARRAGRVVPAAVLFKEALGYDASAQQTKDILKVHVRRIRNKIRDAGGSADYVCNVRGFGYLLERRARAATSFEPDEDDIDEASNAS